jgi:hypothetical protein
MASSVFPVPSSGGGAALPPGATSTAVSGYSSSGGYTFGTSLAAGNYQIEIQSRSGKKALYSAYAPNSQVTASDIGNEGTAAISLSSSENALSVGSYYPLTAFRTADGIMIGSPTSTIYANNLYVIGTDAGYIYTSTNGVTWTNRTSGAEGTGCFYAIKYLNGTFVTFDVNATGFFYYSTNGTTWTKSASIGSASHTGMEYSPSLGLYVLITNAGQLYTATSLTGTWTSRTSGASTNSINAIAYGLIGNTGHFVYIADGQRIGWSTDGTTWSGNTLSGTTYKSVIYKNNRFIVTGNNAGSLYIRTNTGTANAISSFTTIYNTSQLYANCWITSVAGTLIALFDGNAPSGSGYYWSGQPVYGVSADGLNWEWKLASSNLPNVNMPGTVFGGGTSVGGSLIIPLQSGSGYGIANNGAGIHVLNTSLSTLN